MANSNPPLEVTLTYRPVGAGHVFTADGMPGVHIGSSSMERAYSLAIKGIGEHVSELSGQKVWYSTDTSFEQFKACIESESLMANFLLARRRDGVHQQERVPELA